MSSDVTFDKVKDNYVKIVDQEVNNVLQPRRGDKLAYDQKSADDWSKDIADNILKATEKENKNNDFKLIVSVSIFQKGNASLYGFSSCAYDPNTDGQFSKMYEFDNFYAIVNFFALK